MRLWIDSNEATPLCTLSNDSRENANESQHAPCAFTGPKTHEKKDNNILLWISASFPSSPTAIA
jgi:hypothetical protein